MIKDIHIKNFNIGFENCEEISIPYRCIECFEIQTDLKNLMFHKLNSKGGLLTSKYSAKLVYLLLKNIPSDIRNELFNRQDIVFIDIEDNKGNWYCFEVVYPNYLMCWLPNPFQENTQYLYNNPKHYLHNGIQIEIYKHYSCQYFRQLIVDTCHKIKYHLNYWWYCLKSKVFK